MTVLPAKMRVGIYMPVYNGAKYVREAIESILQQTMRDFRLLIVDDGSTDDTVKICSEMAAQDVRISLTVHPVNRGHVAARNTAIQILMADPQFEFLTNHDSDDISSPAKLAKLVAHLDANPSVSIVGCLAHYCGLEKQLPNPRLAIKAQDVKRAFLSYNSMIGSAALVRRQVIEKIGLYRDKWPSVDDYDFFSRALIAGFALENLPEDLHAIRLRPDSLSNMYLNKTKKEAELVRNMLKSHFRSLCILPLQRLQTKQF